MRSIYLVPFVLMAAVAGTTVAVAGKGGKQVRYHGIHPIPKSEGGGLCYIEGRHVHIFAANKLEYRDHRGANYFVGDPAAYGYDGPKHTYKGHHPIHVHAVVGDDHEDVEYCYLDGPHYHSFAPPEGPDFEVRGGVNFYVGTPAPIYLEARPALVKVNAVYTPLTYERPVVTVEAPPAWIGVRAGFAPAVVIDSRPPAVVVETPRVRAGVSVDVVVPPPPSISVDVGIGVGSGGGVIVGGPGQRHGKFKHKKHRGRGRGRW
ncbi:MAG: hypothetical protein SFX73_13810 [Kofleriaceae bacterium]|nr:hypothetical protein [Kofleriaceae bacterium]